MRYLCLLLAALLLAGCGLFDRTPDPAPAAQEFLDGMAEGTVDPELLTDPAAAAAANELLTATVEELGGPPSLELGTVETAEETAVAPVSVTWTLPSGSVWRYDVSLPLVLEEDAWRVAWGTGLVHPQLGIGQALDFSATVPERAPILDADGQPLFAPRDVVRVGIEPQRAPDPEPALVVLSQTLGIEPDPLRERVRAASPEAFVDVITLRREDYEPLRATLQPVPGLVFREGVQQLTPSRTFARALLGRMGPATAEVLEEAGPAFAGADLGLSGLQRTFQEQLAGRPGASVAVRSAQDDQGPPVVVVFEEPAQPGEPLRSTLSPSVQQAADGALAGVANPAALVAVRTTTGEVLAVAQGPDGGTAPTALTGQYPPGSTFKVVSTAALLTAGLTPDQPVECPPTVSVGGREFRNAEGRASGRVPFRRAFAQSCNTTVVPLALELPEGAVRQAAEGFGFGGDWNPGVEAYTGQIPPPSDDVERAAESIGQGRVLASPLLMAGVAAAVADGTWRPPVLLPDHADPGSGPKALDPATAASLRDFMRAVVTEGTGSALRGVPGAPVHGKTGTAEFGEEVPPRTHAWFIGYRGDLAVVVLVEDGGGGGAVAAPIAARFFGAVAP